MLGVKYQLELVLTRRTWINSTFMRPKIVYLINLDWQINVD